MRFIIGGAFQGKLEFACRLLGRDQIERASYADGAEDSFEEALKRPVIYRFHQYVRRLLEEEQSIEGFLALLEEQNPEAVIIMDEVGYGIVPIRPEERRFREEAGRTGQKLAKKAEEVYRVICGIGTRLR